MPSPYYISPKKGFGGFHLVQATAWFCLAFLTSPAGILLVPCLSISDLQTQGHCVSDRETVTRGRDSLLFLRPLAIGNSIFSASLGQGRGRWGS